MVGQWVFIKIACQTNLNHYTEHTIKQFLPKFTKKLNL